MVASESDATVPDATVPDGWLFRGTLSTVHINVHLLVLVYHARSGKAASAVMFPQ